VAEDNFCAGDKDVLARRWLLIDTDPVRPASVSASDPEKALALEAGVAIRAYLHDLGWPDPVCADSGNGGHLLYRVELPADEGGLLKRVLLALATRLDSAGVKIDVSVFNPSRICKLYGTLARKGDNIPERPRRPAVLLDVPGCADPHDVSAAQVVPVPRDLLEALAAEAPVGPKPQPAAASDTGNGNGEFRHRLKVGEWLTDRGIEYTIKDRPDGSTAYLLGRCPFNPDHTGKDVAIFQWPDGRLGAMCFHSSCAENHWQEFKEQIGKPSPEHYDLPLPVTRRRPGKRAKRSVPPAHGTPAREQAAGLPAPRDGDDGAGPQPEALTQHLRPQAEEGDGAGAGAECTMIVCNDRQLREITQEALDAIVAANDPPALFVRGGLLTRVRVHEEHNTPYLEPLTNTAIRGILSRVANWVILDGDGGGGGGDDGGGGLTNTFPPKGVAADLATLPVWKGIPILKAVVECPVLAEDGSLVMQPGYNAAARLRYHPAPGLSVAPVPENPSAEDIARAKALLGELLADFPFADEASRANALAALLLPFVRSLIAGPTPLHLIDAPTPGTGKSLRAHAICIPATGREAEATTEGSDQDEWRKRILSVLAESPTYVLLDNLRHTLDSAALASAVTARVWKDRILGVSKMAALPVACTWLATGNNTELSHEMIRRTALIRLDAKRDQPWTRKGFRHPRLIAWAQEHRGELVWAALVLCRAWLVAGRPKGQRTLGMFEGWVETLGGILDVAGVPGLLGNADELLREADKELPQSRAFATAWWEAHGDCPVATADLFALASGHAPPLLPEVLHGKGKPDEHGQRIRLGKAVGRKRGCVCGSYRIESAGVDRSGCQLYRLRQHDSADMSADPAGTAEEAGGSPHGEQGCMWER
jgi:hypothetical protein